MKREFLEGLDLGEGVKLSKEIIDRILDENGKDLEAQKATVTTLTTERDGLRTQLDEANTTIQSYKDLDIEGIRQSAADWETKYNTDTQALRDQLAAVEYGHAVEAAVSGMKFSSASARKAFLADLTAQKLPLQEGRLLGLDDFTNTYRKSDPDAFAPEKDNTPIFTRGSGGGAPAGGTGGTLKDAISAAIKTQTKD